MSIHSPLTVVTVYWPVSDYVDWRVRVQFDPENLEELQALEVWHEERVAVYDRELGRDVSQLRTYPVPGGADVLNQLLNLDRRTRETFEQDCLEAYQAGGAA